MSLQVVFQDDFEDGQLDPTWKYIQEWQTDVFTESNGTLNSDGTNTNWSALYVDKQYSGQTKQTVQVNMNSNSTNKSVIILIAKDSSYYYYVIFKWGAQSVELQKVPIGSTDPANDASTIATLASFTPQTDTFQTLEVQYNPSDGTLTITVDNTQIYNNTRSEVAGKTPFSGIGIVKSVQVSFDNYELDAENITTAQQINVLPVISVAGNVTVTTPTQVGGTATTGASFWWILLLILILILLGLGTRRR